MYKICPKCGHERQPSDTGPEDHCPACGLNYKKWMKQRFKPESTPKEPLVTKTRMAETPWWEKLTICHSYQKIDSVMLSGYSVVWLVCLIWGLYLMNLEYYYMASNTRIDIMMPEINNSFMHKVNLVFHEAGHVIFSAFGWFMGVLGGALMQSLVPLVVMFTFLFKEGNLFGAGVGLWWFGQSLIDIAPYINDARNGQMPLLGGTTGADSPGYHDFENILGYLGWMEYDHAIADFVDSLGGFIMILAIAWMGCQLLTAFKEMRQ